MDEPDLIAEIRELVAKTQLYAEKTLNEVSRMFEMVGHRTARPFYCLDGTWGLTRLDTGQPFFVNTQDRNVTPWIIMGGHWEPNVGRVLLSYAQPGMTALDIGAHCGYYTVKLGTKLGPSGRLMSFEPNPEVNAVCLENIKINGLLGMTSLHKVALGAIRGKATLTRSDSNMASANLLGDQDANYSVDVEVYRLDDIARSPMIVDLIKLDAEGYEKHILDGGTELLRRSPDCAIMIELSLDRWERLAHVTELVNACGGNKEIYAVHDDGTIERFSSEQLKPFLLTRPFNENYFFVAPQMNVEKTIGNLIR